jgi:hypothetical protein
MPIYQGSCHCGTVRFEVESDLDRVIQCNCSICSKKGALHHRVQPEHFRLLAGHEALAEYQFGTETAKHWFCRHCGIHPFTNPRLDPNTYSVNIRCLDEFPTLLPHVDIIYFNGKHWEQATEGLVP